MSKTNLFDFDFDKLISSGHIGEISRSMICQNGEKEDGLPVSKKAVQIQIYPWEKKQKPLSQ